jgi:hypothetical protein
MSGQCTRVVRKAIETAMSGQAHLATYNALATTLWKAAFCFSGSFAESSSTLNLGCIFLFLGISFLDQKNRPGFLRISFLSCVFQRNFSQERGFGGGLRNFYFLQLFHGNFCRNSCGTGIPAFTMDSSGFLRIPPDSSRFLFPPNAVWLWLATKVGFLLSKYILK